MTLPAALRVGRKPARRPRSPYTAVGLIPSGARVGGMTSPNLEHLRHLMRRAKDGFPSVDAPFQARENVGVVVARGRMLSSVRPWVRQEDSRRPVWEFADRVQFTHSVLEAQW